MLRAPRSRACNVGWLAWGPRCLGSLSDTRMHFWGVRRVTSHKARTRTESSLNAALGSHISTLHSLGARLPHADAAGAAALK